MESGLPWDYVATDDFGTPVIFMSKEIENFTQFLDVVVKEKVGLDRGFFKIRFHTTADETTLRRLQDYAESYFTTKQYNPPSGRRKKGTWKYPAILQQTFLPSDNEHHLYGYESLELNDSEASTLRSMYLERMKCPGSFTEHNESIRLLAKSIDALCDHYWSTVRSASQSSNGMLSESAMAKNDESIGDLKFQEKYASISKNHQLSMNKENNKELNDRGSMDGGNLIVYAAGIPVNVSFNITPRFSLNNLGTLLDIYNGEEIDGVTSPMLYGGLEHSTFPWHTEDGQLFSANYLHCGAPCLWYMVAPDLFKRFTDVAQKLFLDLAHTSCSNIIGGSHKYLVANEEFLSHFKIPVRKVIQREGEMVIVYPYTAHSGFKLGMNFQEAVNFAHDFWIEPAIFSPKCVCFENVVHLDLSVFIESCRPHLLPLYLKRDLLGLAKACSENTFLKRVGTAPSVSNADCVQAKITNCILKCPACDQKYEGGRSKLYRLEKHIEKMHKKDHTSLIKTVFSLYPPKERIAKSLLLCPHCGQLFSGSVSKLRLHISRKHHV